MQAVLEALQSHELLFGPMPTVFLGCTADILTTLNAGHVKLSANTADLGAEQVILVRVEG